ncbi:MAG TPA: hypothetical protein VF516_05245 [Kofleriaceae bacterium]
MPPPDGSSGGARARARAAFDEATLDRRTFRHVLVGALRYPPKRLTWVLFRGAARARLQVFCQTGTPPSQQGLSLNGKENDEALWGAPVLTEYAGARSSENPLSYRLPATAAVAGDSGCEPLPGVVNLVCRNEHVSVLAAGAALIPGKKLPDDRMSPARWDPPARERVAALSCDATADGDAGQRLRLVLSSSPLVFAPGKDGGPGIEWAHENSDQAAQDGAYRWMPMRP